MRRVLLVLGLVLVAGSAAADPPQCKYLDKQVVYYTQQRDRAKQLGSGLWVDRMNTQLGALNARRKEAGCPDRSSAAIIAAELNALLKLAAEGALTFFTMGAM
jgi:hypothetical protein